MNSDEIKNKTVCVVGLGYVGLPLAESYSKHIKTIGFDIDLNKIAQLKENGDKDIIYSDNPSLIKGADYVIVAVPTPLNNSKEPDLSYVESAAEVVGKNLKKDATVVLESTVYPGVTEEVVRPILEKESGMKCGDDFKVGYSPERINPGDEEHSIDKITKIVSGMDDETTEDLSELYSLITKTFKAKDIKTAEAAKVIENIQRDLNIALINELTLIFHKMGLETGSVLEAAGTKWNFHKYVPGLVGGHCLPVDPYYLVYKSREIGHHPQVILAGRSTNDYMPKYIAEMAIKGLNETGKIIKDSKVLIMGLTYKENVSDTRESPVHDILKELKEFGIEVFGCDPLLNRSKIEKMGLRFFENDEKMDCVILAVNHDDFMQMKYKDLKSMMNDNSILIDVKGTFKEITGNIHYKSLNN